MIRALQDDGRITNADLARTGVTGFRFAGERFDCGSVLGFVQATAAFALDRPDLGADFADFMDMRLHENAIAA